MIGRALRVGNYSYPIIGVMPDSVRFPAAERRLVDSSEVPGRGDARARYPLGERDWAIARRRHHPVRAARISRRYRRGLASQFPATDANWTPVVEPLKEETVGGVRRSLWILFGAVTLRAADHVRERGLPAAGTSPRSRARNRHPILAGCAPGPSDPRTAARSPVPGDSRAASSGWPCRSREPVSSAAPPRFCRAPTKSIWTGESSRSRYRSVC